MDLKPEQKKMPELVGLAHDGPPRALTGAFVLLVLGSGCCTLSPRNEKLIAAREHTRQALCAMDRGQFAEARVRFEHALKSCPKDSRARYNYARVLWQEGDREAAIEELDSAVRVSGGDPVWRVELGRMLFNEGAIDGALECAEVALDRERDLAAAWVLRGDALRVQLENDLARKSYYRALSCQNCEPRALLELAELYRLQGRPRRALSSLQRLESEYPPSRHPPRIAYLQGLALQALGRHADAIDKFELARGQLGDDSELLLMLAESQFQVGSLAEARASMELAAAGLGEDPRLTDLSRRLRSRGNRLANAAAY